MCSDSTDPHRAPDEPRRGIRLLLTAGPTQEPIDAVRYIGNRSSGRLGVALADEAARRGWNVTLLLGPTPRMPSDSRVTVHRFRTTADLQALLERELPPHDALIMAAAVADYRPKIDPTMLTGKHRRDSAGMVIHLEATPDLLAGCVGRRRPGQVLVGFALEPRDRMMESARSKLIRKGVDLIVANPLETMDGDAIEAVVMGREGSAAGEGRRTDGAIPKAAFAAWLLKIVEDEIHATQG